MSQQAAVVALSVIVFSQTYCIHCVYVAIQGIFTPVEGYVYTTIVNFDDVVLSLSIKLFMSEHLDV